MFTPFERGVGLPIGNLTSQHFANRYLSPVDHRMTDRLRARAYLRYMDDMLLFDDDRGRLVGLGHALEEACLRLHPSRVVPTAAGVSWVGFRILPREVRVRRSTVARAERRLARMVADGGLSEGTLASLKATFAHWEHADTWRLRRRAARGTRYPGGRRLAGRQGGRLKIFLWKRR